MNCYYHPERQAVGICKSCGRGLSLEFAVDVGNGLACKDHCEERVKSINRMIDNNSRILAVSNTQLRRGMIFTIVSGLLFSAFGFWTGFGEAGFPGILFLGLGLAFVVKGIFSYTRSAKYPTNENK